MSKKRHVCCIKHFFNDRDADEFCPCSGKCGFHARTTKKKGARK